MYVSLLEPFTLVCCCILLWLLVNLEVYLFERTFPVSLCCLVQVVTFRTDWQEQDARGRAEDEKEMDKCAGQQVDTEFELERDGERDGTDVGNWTARPDIARTYVEGRGTQFSIAFGKDTDVGSGRERKTRQ